MHSWSSDTSGLLELREALLGVADGEDVVQIRGKRETEPGGISPSSENVTGNRRSMPVGVSAGTVNAHRSRELT